MGGTHTPNAFSWQVTVVVADELADARDTLVTIVVELVPVLLTLKDLLVVDVAIAVTEDFDEIAVENVVGIDDEAPVDEGEGSDELDSNPERVDVDSIVLDPEEPIEIVEIADTATVTVVVRGVALELA
ncbi:hypothetical protein MBLNU459_g7904t1 [Dothideomycetes sp. NU459]